VAQSLGVNETYVQYVDSASTQTGRTRDRLRRQLAVYTVTAITSVVVPLVHYPPGTRAEELFVTLRSSLHASLTNSTTFVERLAAASLKNGATHTRQVGSVSVAVSVPTVVYPATDTPSSAPVLAVSGVEDTDQGSFSVYNLSVIAVCVSILLGVAMCYVRHIRKQSRPQPVTKMRTPKSTVTFHNPLREFRLDERPVAAEMHGRKATKSDDQEKEEDTSYDKPATKKERTFPAPPRFDKRGGDLKNNFDSV
jgi:hypothetical protein